MSCWTMYMYFFSYVFVHLYKIKIVILSIFHQYSQIFDNTLVIVFSVKPGFTFLFSYAILCYSSSESQKF